MSVFPDFGIVKNISNEMGGLYDRILYVTLKFRIMTFFGGGGGWGPNPRVVSKINHKNTFLIFLFNRMNKMTWNNRTVTRHSRTFRSFRLHLQSSRGTSLNESLQALS